MTYILRWAFHFQGFTSFSSDILLHFNVVVLWLQFFVSWQAALLTVQPSAKREGFATIPDVTWEDVGALKDVREELTMAILVISNNCANIAVILVLSPQRLPFFISLFSLSVRAPFCNTSVSLLFNTVLQREGDVADQGTWVPNKSLV